MLRIVAVPNTHFKPLIRGFGAVSGVRPKQLCLEIFVRDLSILSANSPFVHVPLDVSLHHICNTLFLKDFSFQHWHVFSTWREAFVPTRSKSAARCSRSEKLAPYFRLLAIY